MSENFSMTPTAVCEDCWLSEHVRWEPESIDETGSILMRLSGVDVPEKKNNGSVEVCGLCGAITIAGIYEFRSIDSLISLEDDNNEYVFDLNDEYSEEDEEHEGY